MVKFIPVEDDGGRIAPVSYLPGAHAPVAGETTGADAHRPAAGSRASRVAVHQLARRGMSRWELEQVLCKRGVEDDTAAAELDRLESVGLLDDAALAVTLVFTLHARRGFGRTAIAQELARRHLDPEVIADALSEIEDDDERERALELAVKRIGQLSAYDDATVERRLTAFLARKGYASAVVREAVTAAMDARGPRSRVN